MALKTTNNKARGTSKGKVHVSSLQLTGTGKETWIISRDGKTERLTTSVSSTATMDVATTRYETALKRLAKK